MASDPNLNVTPAYVRAGSAILTISNGSGDHYTFRITKVPADPPRHSQDAWFVNILTGPDVYTYIGMVKMPNDDSVGDPTIRFTAKSVWRNRNTNPVKALEYTLKAIWQAGRGTYTLPGHITIKHNGTCGRCGAQLTHPASIDTGFGPECAGKAGVDWREHDRPTLEEEVNQVGVKLDFEEVLAEQREQ